MWTGSIGHHPELSVAPARWAICPACWGGITLATAGWNSLKSVVSVLVLGFTAITLPPLETGTHSIDVPYSSAQAL